MAWNYMKLLFLVTVYTSSLECSVASEGCLYENTSLEFSACISNITNGNSLDDIIESLSHSRTVVTGEDVLSELEPICRDEAYTRKYTYCARVSMESCPQYSSAIQDHVNQDVAVFCENGQPSNWLSTLMSSDYLYDSRCIVFGNGVLEVIERCVIGAGFLNDHTSLQVSYAVSSMQRGISQWFNCVLENRTSFPDDDSNGVLNCGATWQDVLLMVTLKLSAFSDFGLIINQDIINGLMAIKADQ